MYRGRQRSNSYGDVPTYTRIWMVTVDDANTPFQEISEAPKIAWLAAHPEDSSAFLFDSQVQQDGDSPFHYRVTFSYKGLTDKDPTPTDRPPQFSFSGSLASAPCFWHYPFANNNTDKRVILNSAGDPIGGLDRDEGEFTVTITYNEIAPFNYAKAQQYVGAINSDTWSGGDPKCWKCMSISANRKIERAPDEAPPLIPGEPRVWKTYIYYELSEVLAYRATGWDLQTWDVGFNQIVGGQRMKIMAGGDPVSEPVALSGGAAKAPGQPPDLLSFRIYKMLPFSGTFPVIPDTV
jgi:hypothetical protein